MANQQMPHNLEAEAALLGCLMMDEFVQTEILEDLKEEDFYQESNRVILEAMKRVVAGRKVVDVVTLTDQLERDGTLQRAGGLQALSELSSAIPSAANYRQYYDIIKRDSVNRALIRAAKSIIELCQGGPEEKDAIAFAEKEVFDVSKRGERSQLSDLGDGEVIQGIIEKFETIQSDPNAYRGVETGFTQLDRLTNGLQKSDLIVLAARPGMGKTSLAMNIVEHACLVKGLTAAVFSLEMPKSQIGQRLVFSHGGVSMERGLAGKLTQKDWKNIILAGDRLQKSRIYIDDSSRVTPAEILSKCRRLAASEAGLDLVMIDYIQLMGADQKFGRGEVNRQQEVASITRDLKLMAKELDVPVIALSQLRRIESKEPQLSDLRESGAIEQDADIVMFINRPDVTASKEDIAQGKVVKGAAELVIAKHRNGSLGRIQLRFIGESTRFVDVEDQNRPTEEPIPYKKPAGGDPPPDDNGGIPYE